MTTAANYLQRKGLTFVAGSIERSWANRREVHEILSSNGYSIGPDVLKAHMDQCSSHPEGERGAGFLYELRMHLRGR